MSSVSLGGKKQIPKQYHQKGPVVIYTQSRVHIKHMGVYYILFIYKIFWKHLHQSIHCDYLSWGRQERMRVSLNERGKVHFKFCQFKCIVLQICTTITAREMNKNIFIFKGMTQGLPLTRMAEFPYDKPSELSDINYIIRSPHPQLNDLPVASHCSYNQNPSQGSPSPGRLTASSPPGPSLTGSSHRNLFFQPPNTPSWFPPLGLCLHQPLCPGMPFLKAPSHHLKYQFKDLP